MGNNKKKNQAVVGLGSNIRPSENIARAKENFAQSHRIVAESQFIKTDPIGYPDQPDFVNGVVLIETDMDFDELKCWLADIECKLGRVRTANRYGPRPIDLDIAVWNGHVVDDDVYERDFLRTAVLEVCPHLKI